MEFHALLEARIAISEAQARYCRFLDSKNWEGFSSLFSEDFELDLSAASSLGVIRCRAAAVAQIRSSIETAQTVHHVHSPEMDITQQRADVIWAMQDRVVWNKNKTSINGYGHYHQKWVKQDDDWKITAQKLTRLHVDIVPAEGMAY
jgi:hypothetical protein